MSKPSKLVYLAQPGDFGSADPTLVNHAMAKLLVTGLTVYSPLDAFRVAGKPSSAVNEVNTAAMCVAAGAVAFLPRGVNTIGVPAEISWFIASGRPTVIVTDLDTSSWVVAGWADCADVMVVPEDPNTIDLGVHWLQVRLDTYVGAPHSVQDKIVFEQLRLDAQLPTRGYPTDAGYDLYTVDDHTIEPGEFYDVPCGVAVDLPDNTWGQITGRSSTLRTRQLRVAQGVIDSGYTGPLFAGCENATDAPITIKAGERIAQLILHYAPGTLLTPAWGQVRNKDRGQSGFGSTG